MSTSSTMRYRGASTSTNPNTSITTTSSSSSTSKKSNSSFHRAHTNKHTSDNNNPLDAFFGGSSDNKPSSYGEDNKENEVSAPLLENSEDPTTRQSSSELMNLEPSATSSASASASSSSSTCCGNASNEQNKLVATLSSLARKVRCKFLDKVPVSVSGKFAVSPPPEERLRLLRRFIAKNVESVSTASAEEEGLKPRQRVHYDMIKALWERLNEKAPRCVRRKYGEEGNPDLEICDKKLTGKNWSLIGFQGRDPATDFRAAGAVALEHLLHFVTKHPRLLESIAETPPEHAPITANYPFAVASINITMLLLDMLKSAAEATSEPGQAKDHEAAAKNTTGQFHVGAYSGMEARRKLAHFLIDPNSTWKADQSYSSSSSSAAPTTSLSTAAKDLPWTATQFKNDLEKKQMDLIFGDDDDDASAEEEGNNDQAAAQATATATSSSNNNLSSNTATNPEEDKEMEQIAERLAAIHVVACRLLHEEWKNSKRNVLYFNEVFKSTAAKIELLFRDAKSFDHAMSMTWKD